MGSYGKLCTAYYDLDKPSAPSDALAFYQAKAAQSSGPVLEPMCGSGRFLIPLLQAGIPIEGVDASGDMLAACELRAASLGLTPKLYEQALEELSLPGRYSLAFIPSGSLGLIHQKETLRACLRGLHRHLDPSASLFVEVIDAESFGSSSSEFGSSSVAAQGGKSISYEWRTTCDTSGRTIHYDSRYELREGGSVLAAESEQLVIRMYTSQEVIDELQLAGYSDPRVVHRADQKDWLRESGCSLYGCTVPEGGFDA